MNRSIILSIAAVGLMLLGCSEKSTKSVSNTGFISGHVTLDGQPALGIVITVMPYVILNGNAKTEEMQSQASTLANGEYQIEMVPGSYKVTFTLQDRYGLVTSRYPIEVNTNQTTALNVEMKEPAAVNLLAIEFSAEVRLTFEGAYNANRIQVYRAPANSDQFELVADTAYNGYYFNDSPADIGSYKYYVVTFNTLGSTSPSNTATVTLTGIPLAPTDIRVYDYLSYVTLYWETIPNVDKFNIYRSTNGNDWILIGTTLQYGYSDTPSTYTNFQYRIKSVSRFNIESPPSPAVGVNFDGRLDPPTGLVATDGGNCINLRWNYVSYLNPYYKVYRAVGETGEFTLITTTTSDPSYTDRPVDNGLYRYRITGFISSEPESDPSVEVSVSYDGRLDPPQNIIANEDGFAVHVSWDYDPQASFHGIYRSDDNGQHFNRVGLTNYYYAFFDTSLTAGAYQYKVTSITSDGLSESEMSEPVQFYYSGEASAPEWIGAHANGRTIIISWQSVMGAYAYRVLRSSEMSGNYVLIEQGIIETNYEDNPDSAGDYYYKIQAYNNRGQQSALSQARYVHYSGLPIAPSWISVYNGIYNVSLNWYQIQETGIMYIVYRLDLQSNQYVPIDSTTSTSLIDWPAEPGIYWYKVRTKQDGYYSELSDPAWVSFSAVLDAPRMYYCLQQDTIVIVAWYGVTGAQKYNAFKGRNRDDLTFFQEVSDVNACYDMPTQEGWYYYAVSAETQGGLESPRSDIDSVLYIP